MIKNTGIKVFIAVTIISMINSINLRTNHNKNTTANTVIIGNLSI